MLIWNVWIVRGPIVFDYHVYGQKSYFHCDALKYNRSYMTRLFPAIASANIYNRTLCMINREQLLQY